MSKPQGNNNKRQKPRKEKPEFDQAIVDLARVTRVTKGGKHLSFRALVLIGDRKGKVGYGVEKGADVQIAVDLLIGAYENLYDTAILVSSDTDLIPALAKARSMKKKIEYIGFSHKPSYGLITHSDIRRLLTKEDIEQFFNE